MVRVDRPRRLAGLLLRQARPGGGPPHRERGGPLHPGLPRRAPDDGRAPREQAPEVELTYNWDPEAYTGGRNFGHLAYAVDDIYATCQRLMDGGVTINRPPRDGRMAFVRSPDGISIELLQAGAPWRPPSPGPPCRTWELVGPFSLSFRRGWIAAEPRDGCGLHTARQRSPAARRFHTRPFGPPSPEGEGEFPYPIAPAVVGSIIRRTSVILFAGKPDSSAWRRMPSSSSAR